MARGRPGGGQGAAGGGRGAAGGRPGDGRLLASKWPPPGIKTEQIHWKGVQKLRSLEHARRASGATGASGNEPQPSFRATNPHAPGAKMTVVKYYIEARRSRITHPPPLEIDKMDFSHHPGFSSIVLPRELLPPRVYHTRQGYHVPLQNTIVSSRPSKRNIKKT